MLLVNDIHTYYGLAHVLHGVSLEVGDSEIVALLGRNGAGKSTTLKSIVGLTPPRRGEVLFEGQNITTLPTHLIARRGVAYVPEERRIFGGMTVTQNLKVSTLPFKSRLDVGASIEAMFEMFPRLRERAHQLGRSLSGGEQQMLALARALISQPRLMLIDEPTQGLAPNLVTAIAASLVRIKEQGLSVLLVEQNARVALSIADRAYVIDQGVIQYSGSARDLQQNAAVQREFLTV
jgi:branched-chain amino acid transport system ATP-binding protein